MRCSWLWLLFLLLLVKIVLFLLFLLLLKRLQLLLLLLDHALHVLKLDLKAAALRFHHFRQLRRFGQRAIAFQLHGFEFGLKIPVCVAISISIFRSAWQECCVLCRLLL